MHIASFALSLVAVKAATYDRFGMLHHLDYFPGGIPHMAAARPAPPAVVAPEPVTVYDDQPEVAVVVEEAPPPPNQVVRHESPKPSFFGLTPDQPSRKEYTRKEPFELVLRPFVNIGVQSVRAGPRHDPPPGHKVACPSDRAYCIDYRGSDNGTCLYPDPVAMKKCYDNSCVDSSWGPIVRRQQGEDTYCKDFMTAQGRLCQWVDNLPCTCESKSIFYYSGEFIPAHDPIPAGFAEASICTYPLDLIKRAAEEAALKAREKREQANKRGGPNRGRGRQRSGDPANADGESVMETREERRQRRQQADAENGVTVGFIASVGFVFLVPALLSVAL